MPTLCDWYANLDRMIRQFQRDPQLINRLRADPTSELHMVDYGHLVDGTLYHGTVSDLSGPVQSTWTFEEEGRLVRRDQPIDQQTFTRLWADVFRLPVFQRSLSDEPSTVIDPATQHVVAVIYTEKGDYKRACYLVPVDEPSAEFAEWLQALNRPLPQTSTAEEQRASKGRRGHP